MADDDLAGLAERMAAMRIADKRAGEGPSATKAGAPPPAIIPLKSRGKGSAPSLPPIPMRPYAQPAPVQPPIPMRTSNPVAAPGARGGKPVPAGANGSEPELDALTAELAAVSLEASRNADGRAAPTARPACTAPAEPKSADARGLRDYQRWMVDSLWGLVRRNRAARAAGAPPVDAPGPSVLVYLPTGGGKTRVAAELIRLAVGTDFGSEPSDDDGEASSRALFVVNRTRLAHQAGEALSLACGSDAVGYVQAGRADGSGCPVVVATAQTLVARFLIDQVEGGGGGGGGGSGSGVEGRGRGAAESGGDCTREGAASGGRAGGKGRKRQRLPAAGLVIIDEAHCAAAATYARMCGAYRAAGAVMVGLSATPTRLRSDESLGLVFDRILEGPGVGELVDRGVLVPPVTLACAHALVGRALAGVGSRRCGKGESRASRTAGGRRGDNSRNGGGCATEFDQRELAKAMEAEAVVAAAAAAWVRHAKGRRTVAFCVTVHQAALLAAALRERGVAAAVVEASTKEAGRDAAFDALRTGETRVLCSVGVLSEGFDEPAVGCVLLLRPTQSKVRHGLQAAASSPQRARARRGRLHQRCRRQCRELLVPPSSASLRSRCTCSRWGAGSGAARRLRTRRQSRARPPRPPQAQGAPLRGRLRATPPRLAQAGRPRRGLRAAA